jgi:hypothetical protein
MQKSAAILNRHFARSKTGDNASVTLLFDASQTFTRHFYSANYAKICSTVT